MKIETKYKEDAIDVEIEFENDNSFMKVTNSIIAIINSVASEFSRVAASEPEAKENGLSEAKLRHDIYIDLARVLLNMAAEAAAEAEDEVDG